MPERLSLSETVNEPFRPTCRPPSHNRIIAARAHLHRQPRLAQSSLAHVLSSNHTACRLGSNDPPTILHVSGLRNSFSHSMLAPRTLPAPGTAVQLINSLTRHLKHICQAQCCKVHRLSKCIICEPPLTCAPPSPTFESLPVLPPQLQSLKKTQPLASWNLATISSSL